MKFKIQHCEKILIGGSMVLDDWYIIKQLGFWGYSTLKTFDINRHGGCWKSVITFKTCKEAEQYIQDNYSKVRKTITKTIII